MSPGTAGQWLLVGGLVVLLVGEWQGRPLLRAVGKPTASLGFIVAALGFGALESRYGNIVLAGLILGAIGDVCLLGTARRHFSAGLVAFLLGHVAYTVAFLGLAIDRTGAAISAGAVVIVMLALARWVLPYAAAMRIPIGAYMVVIGAMCVVAFGAGAAGASWLVPGGALLFAASDIAVVRDRFVSQSFINRLWGLPLYYLAQWLLARSITTVGA